jgi:NADH-quinone oxidoreductase subunit L
MSFSIFHLAWLIPLSPLLVFVAIILLVRGSRSASRPLAVYGIAIATALALLTFLAAMLEALDGEPDFGATLIDGWIPLALLIDPFSALMLAALSLVCLVVFVYSLGAVENDADCGRFFAFLSLLAASALALFIFDNLLLAFVCWEIMDVAAYLLTGFHSEQASARRAAIRVFLMTKLGGSLFLLGIVLLYGAGGAPALVQPFNTATLSALSGTSFLGLQTPLAAAVLLLAGVMIKSAQFPFHTWLVETTEAPLPASALIHVTSASATAFVLIRIFALFEIVSDSLLIPGLELTVIAFVGVVTAALTTLFALTQHDIRRALSFFAIAQMGLVFIALGTGTAVAAVFHLVAGMFFNTLLFLAAGSVIRGVARGHPGGVERGALDPHDLSSMGGLGERQPLTFLLFLFGGAALAGSPLITGAFWSRDAILTHMWLNHQVLFWILTAITAATAFGVMRLLGLAFTGAPRTEGATQAVEGGPWMILPLILLWLVILVMGWAGLPEEFPVSVGENLFAIILRAEEVVQFSGDAMVWWSLVSVLGLPLGFLAYAMRPMKAGGQDWLESLMRAMWLGWLYDLLRNGLYIDVAYEWVFGQLPAGLGAIVALFDRGVDDLIAAAMQSIGRGLALLGDWVESHALIPAFGSIDLVVEPVAQFTGWLDRLAGGSAELVAFVADFPARVADTIDRGLYRLVILVKPGTVALAQLTATMEDGLEVGVWAVGHTVRTAGRWFRPKSGKVQSYLRMVSIAVVVLTAMLIVFAFL